MPSIMILVATPIVKRRMLNKIRDLAVQGRDQYNQGEYEQALATLEAVLAMTPYIFFYDDIRQIEATSCWLLASAYAQMGDIKRAIHRYQKTIGFQAKLHRNNAQNFQVSDLARSYKALGDTYYNIRDYYASLESHQKAADLWDSSQNRLALAATKSSMGSALHQLGELDQARVCFLDSIDGFEDADPRSVGLGKSYFAFATLLEHFPECVEEKNAFYRKSISVFEQHSQTESMNPTDLGRMNCELAIAHAKGQNLKEARVFVEQAVQFFKASSPESHDSWRSSHSLGQILFRQDAIDLALDRFHEAVEIATRTKSPSDLATTYHAMGSAFLSRGDYRRAMTLLTKSIKIHEQCHSVNSWKQGLFYKFMYLFMNVRPQSLDLLKQAESYKLLGFAFDGQGHHAQAVIYYKEAMNASEQAGYLDFEACQKLGIAAALAMAH